MRKRFVTVALVGALIAGTGMVGTASAAGSTAAGSTAAQVVHVVAPTDLYGPYGIALYPAELDCVYAGEYFRILGYIAAWICTPYAGSGWELQGYYEYPLG